MFSWDSQQKTMVTRLPEKVKNYLRNLSDWVSSNISHKSADTWYQIRSYLLIAWKRLICKEIYDLPWFSFIADMAYFRMQTSIFLPHFSTRYKNKCSSFLENLEHEGMNVNIWRQTMPFSGAYWEGYWTSNPKINCAYVSLMQI